MYKLEEVDKNFIVQTDFDTEDLSIYNPIQKPFEINGLFPPKNENDLYRRMPEEKADFGNRGVLLDHTCTAGGRVRFRTNASKIAIFTKMKKVGHAPHFSLAGKAGFDLYVNNRYFKTFMPPLDIEARGGYNSIHDTGNREGKEILINFPTYGDVVSIFIGLDKDATVLGPTPYRFPEPIVYYGNSITQGGCASRPGNTYQAIISRRLDCDFVNLGFTGNAKGEPEMAEYIAGLTMKAFVCDYDANARTPEHLRKTHQKFFQIVRDKNPELPIILVSYPNTDLDAPLLERREIIRKTYQDAVDKGDKNVYFIDGCAMMRAFSEDNSTTVDGCHPNDFGFMAMAAGIGSVLQEILK